MPYMYILQCNDNSYYTGSTYNLEKRLYEHQTGQGANYTAKRLPIKLIYSEQTDKIEDAYAREQQIKGWSRKKKEALMKNHYNELKILSKSKKELNHEQL
ncbi:MAG: hypothetical protein CSA42_05215 [Gammaproteobacteria bacterium]|nr:MAG: hypothetical protein CSA42_05215 [Gammaproteobacteria bacterium]